MGREAEDAAGLASPKPIPPAVGIAPKDRVEDIAGGGGVGADAFGVAGGATGGGARATDPGCTGAVLKEAGATDGGGGGGGGGATAGLPARKAFRAACSARLGSLLKLLPCEIGGGGCAEGMFGGEGVDLANGEDLGAPAGGMGGAGGGFGLAVMGGGGAPGGIEGAVEEGFLDDGGGIGGFLPIGGGALGFENGTSGLDCVVPGVGLKLFFSAVTDGT